VELVSVNVILETLADDKTLVLLDTIALSGLCMDAPITNLGITRKQYYSRIRSLTNSGLITRQKGKYYLTSLGKIVSFYQFRIGRALNNFWKLKALDSISNETTNDLRLKQVYLDLVNSLIDDVEIREILISCGTSSLIAKSNVLPEINIEAQMLTSIDQAKTYQE
jgi:hypothetical protein